MKFKVQKRVLNDALSRVQGVVDKKTAIPILECVLVQSDGSQLLKICASNLDMNLVSEIQVEEVDSVGSMCIPAHKFATIIKNLDEGTVEVYCDTNDWAHISCGTTKYKVPSPSASSFPTLPTGDDLEWISIPAAALKQMLQGVAFAVGTSSDQRLIEGAKLEIESGEIRMIATDGCRLAFASVKIDSLLMEELDVLLPQAAMDELGAFLTDYEGFISVALGNNKIFFKAEGRQFSSRLLDGSFPKYNATLTSYENAALFKSDVLVSSIRRALVVLESEKKRSVILDFEENLVRLSAKTAKDGEVNESAACMYSGPVLKLCLNGELLMQFIKLFPGSNIRFELKDAKTQVHLTTVKDTITFRYILMPQNL